MGDLQSTYAGIGSRTTPERVVSLMTRLGKELAALNWRLRSGGSGAADLAFEAGVRSQHPPDHWVHYMEIYLPWPGFDQRGVLACDYSLRERPTAVQAWALARSVHTHWDNLKDSGRKLHARNSFQILGPQLLDPVDYVVYYSKPMDNGEVSGGTRTAVEIARLFKVREINLYTVQAQDALEHALHTECGDPLLEVWLTLQRAAVKERVFG